MSALQLNFQFSSWFRCCQKLQIFPPDFDAEFNLLGVENIIKTCEIILLANPGIATVVKFHDLGASLLLSPSPSSSYWIPSIWGRLR